MSYKAEPSEDYYALLGCHPSASDEQILTEYRDKARKFHPDKDGTNEQFQQIQVAKQVLLDKSQRKLYDSWRTAGLALSFQQWLGLQESVLKNMSQNMHWATPNLSGRMVATDREMGDATKSRQSKFWKMGRSNSIHTTAIMVNPGDDMRKQFRNYQI